MRRVTPRTCIGCRQVRPKEDLLRLVRGPGGVVEVDWGRGRPGRGAYVCISVECLDKALTRGRLEHAFRRSSTPPVASAASIVARGKELGSRARTGGENAARGGRRDEAVQESLSPGGARLWRDG